MIKIFFYGVMLDINLVEEHPGRIKKTDKIIEF